MNDEDSGGFSIVGKLPRANILLRVFSEGEPMVDLHRDGTVEFYDAYEPVPAAQAVWKSLAEEVVPREDFDEEQRLRKAAEGREQELRDGIRQAGDSNRAIEDTRAELRRILHEFWKATGPAVTEKQFNAAVDAIMETR